MTHPPTDLPSGSPTGDAGPGDAPARVTRSSTAIAVGAVVAAVAVGVLVANTVGGFGGSDNANGSVPVTDAATLDGSWRAVNSVGAPAEVVGDVVLRFEDGRVGVQTGCNNGGGAVSVEDSRLVAGPLMSTKMACEAPLMEQEAWLFEMVSARPRLELSGPYLSLHWGGSDGERWWMTLENQTPVPS